MYSESLQRGEGSRPAPLLRATCPSRPTPTACCCRTPLAAGTRQIACSVGRGRPSNPRLAASRMCATRRRWCARVRQRGRTHTRGGGEKEEEALRRWPSQRHRPGLYGRRVRKRSLPRRPYWLTTMAMDVGRAAAIAVAAGPAYRKGRSLKPTTPPTARCLRGPC